MLHYFIQILEDENQDCQTYFLWIHKGTLNLLNLDHNLSYTNYPSKKCPKLPWINLLIKSNFFFAKNNNLLLYIIY